jgi:biofilm PGA synthesis N-glycosyltransferase PgaC
MWLIGGLFILILASVPYIIYILGIQFGKKTDDPPKLTSFPSISIVIPALNEEAVIERRMRNIAASTYPKDRYEVILIDDNSRDRTAAIAGAVLKELGIEHTVLTNESRMGTNRSFNRGIKVASHDIICTTGADVFFREDAVERVIARLLSDGAIAAVCADMLPLPSGSAGISKKTEEKYRSYYGRMCDWESAADSTYNFNGGLVAFRKERIERIRERKGADDANTAFEAIRKGFRAVYEIRAIVYEDIPGDVRQQFRQKSRRATRLIEATLANIDLLRDRRPFSRYFFPLRISLYLVAPVLFCSGVILLLIGIATVSLPVAAVVIAGIGALAILFPDHLIVSFAMNQLYLLVGLLQLGRDLRTWESTSKKEA